MSLPTAASPQLAGTTSPSITASALASPGAWSLAGSGSPAAPDQWPMVAEARFGSPGSLSLSPTGSGLIGQQPASSTNYTYLVSEPALLAQCEAKGSPTVEQASVLGLPPGDIKPLCLVAANWQATQPCDVDPLTLEQIPADFIIRFRAVNVRDVAGQPTIISEILQCRDVRVLKELVERARFEGKILATSLTGGTIPLVFDPVLGISYTTEQIAAIDSHPYSQSFDVKSYWTQLRQLAQEEKVKTDAAAQTRAEEIQAQITQQDLAQMLQAEQADPLDMVAELQHQLYDVQERLRQLQAMIVIKRQQLKGSALPPEKRMALTTELFVMNVDQRVTLDHLAALTRQLQMA